MTRWSTLPFSVAGHVSLIKMATLPELLCFFYFYFFYLDSTLRPILLGGKTPWLKKYIFHILKSKDGPSLPNFLHYLWVGNICTILNWNNLHLPKDYPP